MFIRGGVLLGLGLGLGLGGGYGVEISLQITEWILMDLERIFVD